MTAEEQIARLEEQLAHVLDQLRLKDEQLQLAQEQLRAAQARLEELEKQKTPPPPFVKANVAKPQAEQKQRKKREAKHNHGRPREAPTRTVDHLIKYCPVCASALGGISVARRRQVIELPPPPSVEVTEHVVYHGWCSHCGTWREAPLDVSREVVGQGRLGVKIASLISYLRTVMRLPVRQIQAYLASLHGLSISSGEIIGLAQRVKAQLEPQVAEVQQQIRASPAVQMDETGWREDGSNG
jgi:transposase